MATLLAALALVYASVAQAESINLLSEITPVHLMWIGSPFSEKDQKYKYITDLCQKLRSSGQTPGQRIYIWSDSQFLEGAPVADSGKLGKECDGVRIVFKDVSELFTPGPYDVPEVLDAIDKSLHAQERVSCQQSDQASPSLSPPSLSPSSNLMDILNRTKESYDYLTKLRSSLGNKVFSPMVDLLKVLAVYRTGGIYFDINKDFKNLSFQNLKEKPLKKGALDRCNRIIVGEPVALTVGKEEVGRVTARFFMDDLISMPPHEAKMKSGGMLKREKGDLFYNMDYFASVCPKAKPLENVLMNVSKNYKMLQNEPILQLFLDPSVASSAVWVFSVGGPGAFTQYLNQAPKGTLKIHQTANYAGSQSWRSNSSSDYALLLMRICLGTFDTKEKTVLSDSVENCWNESRVPYSDSGPSKKAGHVVIPEDFQFCIFNKLIDSIRKGLIDDDTRDKRMFFAHDFSYLTGNFKDNIHKACLKSHGFQSEPRDPGLMISEVIDNSLEEIVCSLTKKIYKTAGNYSDFVVNHRLGLSAFDPKEVCSRWP